MHSPVIRAMIGIVLSSLFSLAAQAASVDGVLDGLGEYSFNTEAAPNDKHNTHGHGTPNSEYDDGSDGDPWDINYLGIDVLRDAGAASFQFGAVGGSILGGQNQHSGDDLFLGDIAINIVQSGETPLDPTVNASGSAGWDYALRVLSVSGTTASFELFEFVDNVSSWSGSNIYGFDEDGSDGHVTRTYRMENGNSLATFEGVYNPNAGDLGVLEGAFDLGLLSLFDEQTGGSIITYLTMSCVNDEAIVYADIAAVPLPAAFWLFGSALIGFIGMSRRIRV